jgi:hypothetical protein
MRELVRELLSERTSPEQASSLADKLATGVSTHDDGIIADAAKALGLPVSTEMPEEVYGFMSLFPQPTRTRHRWSMCRPATSRCPGGRWPAELGARMHPGEGVMVDAHHTGIHRIDQNASGAAAMASSSLRV